MKVIIQWQCQHFKWHRFQLMHHLPDAYRTAKHRARQTQKRHRLVDERGRLLDLVEP